MLVSPRFKIAAAIVCLFLFTLVTSVLAIILTALPPDSTREILGQQQRLFPLILLTSLASTAVCILVHKLYSLYVHTPLRMAEDVATLISHSDRRLADVGKYESLELNTLAASIDRLAAARSEVEQEITHQVAMAQQSLEQERSRLAALMADLDQSVIVCNRDGLILLYNQRAQQELSPAAAPDHGTSLANDRLGLGRSIHHVFDPSLIEHARERLQSLAENGDYRERRPVQFIASLHGNRLLRVGMSPVLSGHQLSGYVLMFEDITQHSQHQHRHQRLIENMMEQSRGSIGTLRAAAEMLRTYPDMPEEQSKNFLNIICQEAESLTSHLDRVAYDLSEDQSEPWPLEDIQGAEFLRVAHWRLTASGVVVTLSPTPEWLWLRIDSHALLQALSFLAHHITSVTHQPSTTRCRHLTLTLDEHTDHLARLNVLLEYSPTLALPLEEANRWLQLPVSPSPLAKGAMNAHHSNSSFPSIREIVMRCHGEVWVQTLTAAEEPDACPRLMFSFLLPVASVSEFTSVSPTIEAMEKSHDALRENFYDFDLFSWSTDAKNQEQRELGELAFTVFDTETTGLRPSFGDELIQIGAIRVVNKRLLKNETFEQLIDPHRTLPEESVKIHGIQPEELIGQPGIDRVLPAFHAFCADSVLVAHNAAFDLRFFQIKETQLGIRFNHPVLDTLLLSAVIHPNQSSHKLEAIAERLGVNVTDRHTALGDAKVTAEIFLKMLPLLADLGIHTLGQARAASEKVYYAQLRY